METIMSFVRAHRQRVATAVLVLSAAVLLYGGYALLTYSVPMTQGGDGYVTAHNSLVGDKAAVLYNAGQEAYQEGEFAVAEKLLTKSYSELTDSSGHLPDSRNALAGDIQFLLGNSLVKQKKVKDAVQAYEQSLRHNPNHMYAKYNLEMLQQSGGGSSGGGDGKPGGPGKGGGKKGI
jgi:tetratricopeptide (TPR) repeat protein